MTAQSDRPREFTGKHMLFLIVAFFAVIITVNVTMAVFASSSWSGLVVKNSYVASQHFNERSAEGRARAALGWNAALSIADDRLSWRLTDASGSPVRIDAATAILRRPVAANEDHALTLIAAGDGTHAADLHGLADGVWIVEVDAEAGLGEPYRDIRRIVVKDGRLQ